MMYMFAAGLIVLLSILTVNQYSAAQFATFITACSVGIVDMVEPSLKSFVGGPPIDEFFVGPYIVSSQLVNMCEKNVPFVAFIEVRDSEGVTLSLSFQTGNVEVNGQLEVAMSWVPEVAGSYELRAFAISNFTKPEILSWVRSNEVEIHD